MKRKGNLFNKIVNINNLFLAEKKARRGKSNKPDVQLFIKNLEENIVNLYYELLNKEYRTSEYYIFYLKDYNKEREIFKLPYRDRVVHHAVMNILEKIFVSTFTCNTYSAIKNRGIHLALKRLNKDIKGIGGGGCFWILFKIRYSKILSFNKSQYSKISIKKKV